MLCGSDTEILQTTWKNKTKSIKILDLLIKTENYESDVICFIFSCDLQILICEPQSILHKLLVLSWLYPILDLKPPNLHTYSHQLLGFTIVSRQDAIMRFNVVLFIIISCGFELAVFIHGQHYYYPVAPPSLHCLKKHCDQIVTGKVIIHKSKGWGISSRARHNWACFHSLFKIHI